MVLFENKKVLIAFISIILLWALLPLTTMSTRHTGYFEIGTGYAPVVRLNRHPSPPKINGNTYTNIVWQHERYSILWLPLWGNPSGQYGLYQTIRRGRRSKTLYIPITYQQAQKYAAMVKVKIPPVHPISYWSLLYGWLLFVPLALILYWDPRFYKKLSQFYVLRWN